MEPNLHVLPTPRYAAVVDTDFKAGEKRLLRSRVRFNPTKLPGEKHGLRFKALGTFD